MSHTTFRVKHYAGPDGRTGFVIEEDGQQWPRLFDCRAEAVTEMRRFRAEDPLADVSRRQIFIPQCLIG